MKTKERGNILPDQRNFSLHWLTLRFRDPDIEARFQQTNYERQIGVTRLSIVIGALIFSLFGFLDWYVIPDAMYQAWVLRFGIVLPILLALVALSYTGHINHRNSGWLSLAMCAPGLAVVVMTAIAEPNGAYLYYGGLVVVIGYSNCLWRMSYLFSSIMSLITIAAYETVVFHFNPLPFDLMVSTNTFMVSTVGLSMFLNYIQEQQSRVSYIDNERLRFEQARADTLLSRSESANHAKNDFLAVMSHELRTPLNAIIGFAEIISNEMFGPVGEPKYADYASDIRSSGTHLLSIINDILDISKAEAGKLQLEEDAIDPVEALNRTMRMFRQRASELGIDLSFRVRDDLPWVLADARLFNQVAINLTSNALKFTPQGGKVSVELALASNGDLTVSVQDTGIGIKQEDIARVFEPFVQVEGAMSRSQHGTGLGLPLVRKIMELHGGTITLDSKPGKGTLAVAAFPQSRLVSPEMDDGRKWGTL